MNLGNEVALNTWELNISTVAALETFNLYWHLLSFKSRRDTTNKDYNISRTKLFKQLIIIEMSRVTHIKHQCADTLTTYIA